MSPDILRRAGEVLYGPRWQARLARAIGVDHVTVRRWMRGIHPVPRIVAHDLVKVMRRDMAAIGDVLAELEGLA